MGCDIHVFIERRYGDRWVVVNAEPAPQHIKDDYSIHHWGKYVETDMLEELSMAMLDFPEQIPTSAQTWSFGRNYNAFGQLAGVRSNDTPMKMPTGVPDDASIQVWRNAMMQVVSDEVDENQDLHRHTNYITDKAATTRGMKRFERDGAEWVLMMDWHNPSSYTVRELREGIEEFDQGEDILEGRVRDLLNAMQKVAADYGLTEEDVRTVFWFDN